MTDWARIAERAFLLLLSAGVIARLAPAAPAHPQVAVLLTSELVGVALLLVQRRGAWTREPRAVLVAFVGTGAALLVAPEGRPLVSDAVSSALIVAGGTIALGAKLSIGRSFGVIPANRGVRRGGLYRIVRHPMYAGYVLGHIGFALLYLSAWNLAVYAAAWCALWLRIDAEEAFLGRDPAYRAYARAVRFRLVPGVA